MKEWFPIRADKFKYIDWINGPCKSFNGPLILGGDIASVVGGFGSMIFQGITRPMFDL